MASTSSPHQGARSGSGPGSGYGAGAGSARSATKRLLKELAVWEKEAPAESGIERLGPVSEEELLQWEAVINGRGVGGGYDGACFLLPSVPSAVSFRSVPILYPPPSLFSA